MIIIFDSSILIILYKTAFFKRFVCLKSHTAEKVRDAKIAAYLGTSLG